MRYAEPTGDCLGYCFERLPLPGPTAAALMAKPDALASCSRASPRYRRGVLALQTLAEWLVSGAIRFLDLRWALRAPIRAGCAGLTGLLDQPGAPAWRGRHQ